MRSISAKSPRVRTSDGNDDPRPLLRCVESEFQSPRLDNHGRDDYCPALQREVAVHTPMVCIILRPGNCVSSYRDAVAATLLVAVLGGCCAADVRPEQPEILSTSAGVAKSTDG